VATRHFFSEDIFSNETPIFSEIDRQKSDKIKFIFNTFYDHLQADVITVRKSGGFEINSNNFLIETENASYLLKLFDKLDETEAVSLEKQAALMSWLFNHEASCPSPVKGEGQRYICSIGNGEWAGLMTFVSGLYFPGSYACDVRKMGEAVGLFHAQLRAVPNELKPDRQYPFLSTLDKEMFERVLSDSNNELVKFPESEKSLLIENKSLLLNTWNKVLTFESELSKSEQGVVHIDLHPHNVIMNNGELSAFLDFDSLMIAPVKMMIGFSAYKLLRQVVSKSRNQLSRQEINDVVESYLEGVYKYFPEFRCERNIISLFASAEICRRIAYILRLNIQDENIQWNHVLVIQIKGLKEIEILFDILD